MTHSTSVFLAKALRQNRILLTSYAQLVEGCETPEILDLTRAVDAAPVGNRYWLGRYNEARASLYAHDLFTSAQTNALPRIIHMGLDLGAPEGARVFVPLEGTLYSLAEHQDPGNYGPTVTLKHTLTHANGEIVFYSIYGHLSRASLNLYALGARLRAGDRLGYLGSRTENGGWPPHLHFQLSFHAPVDGDLPGVVSRADHAAALERYPDPGMLWK